MSNVRCFDISIVLSVFRLRKAVSSPVARQGSHNGEEFSASNGWVPGASEPIISVLFPVK